MLLLSFFHNYYFRFLYNFFIGFSIFSLLQFHNYLLQKEFSNEKEIFQHVLELAE